MKEPTDEQLSEILYSLYEVYGSAHEMLKTVDAEPFILKMGAKIALAKNRVCGLCGAEAEPGQPLVHNLMPDVGYCPVTTIQKIMRELVKED